MANFLTFFAAFVVLAALPTAKTVSGGMFRALIGIASLVYAMSFILPASEVRLVSLTFASVYIYALLRLAGVTPAWFDREFDRSHRWYQKHFRNRLRLTKT